MFRRIPTTSAYYDLKSLEQVSDITSVSPVLSIRDIGVNTTISRGAAVKTVISSITAPTYEGNMKDEMIFELDDD